MIRTFEEIDAQLKERQSEMKVMAVAAADESHVLEAVCDAKEARIADAILVGNEGNIKKVAAEHNLDVSNFEIIDIDDHKEAAEKAVALVKEGRAQFVMKGLLDTSVFLRAILQRDVGLRMNDLLSLVAIFQIKDFNRLILMTDPAINIDPNQEQKETMMMNAISVAHALGNECPKVGFVSPIEKVNPKLQSTVDAKAIEEKYADSTDFLVGGPFGLDNAVSEEAATIKGVKGPVAGKADILVMNDLGVANVFYKTLSYFADVRFGSVLVGAAAPVVMASRADSSDTKLNSIKLAVMMAK